MNRTFVSIGALLAALGIAAGAFGAHGLKAVATEKILATFETAVRYQIYDALALLVTGLLMHYHKSKWLLWAGRLFIAGFILFCCSLYLLCAFQVQGNLSMNFLGAITPFGGICMIAGWLLIFAAFMRKAAQ